jgi:hypothetical protein
MTRGALERRSGPRVGSMHRPARRRIRGWSIGARRWRQLRRGLVGALLLVLLAHPVARAASDVFQNVAPPSQLAAGSLPDRYALGNYALDHHFSAVSFSLTGGLDISGVPALIAYFLADVIWQLTAFLANALITIFTFAFSLDLVNGSSATGGAGALAPVSEAIHSLYESTFGAPWLAVAIVAAGLWAMWKALVQRRYTETLGALGLSLLFCLLALWLVTQPAQTIGQASRWTSELSAAFLSLTSNGTVGNQQRAKQGASDQLFSLLVYQPFSVLEFGGTDHCVKTPVGSSPQSVPVEPLSSDPAEDRALSQQLETGTQVQAAGKVCVNNENKYAAHFLAYSPGSGARNSEYNALAAGDPSQLPSSDHYQLGPADKPAADAMGESGQYPRLLMALVIFASELGAFLLLGALSVAVVLAQVLVLLLLAFAPVALVIGVFPGRGHDFFRGWLARLATFLARKAIYSLILAVLLAVAAAVGDATSDLGWLLAFGLQAAFFWAVFLYRHKLTGQLSAATTGTTVKPEEGTLRLAGLYTAGRLARRALPGQHRSKTQSAPAAGPRPSDEAAGRKSASRSQPSRETGANEPAGAQGATTGDASATTPTPTRPHDGGPVTEARSASERWADDPPSAHQAPRPLPNRGETEQPRPPDSDAGREVAERDEATSVGTHDVPGPTQRDEPMALGDHLRQDIKRLPQSRPDQPPLPPAQPPPPARSAPPGRPQGGEPPPEAPAPGQPASSLHPQPPRPERRERGQ